MLCWFLFQIMWRSEAKGQVLQRIFELLRRVFPLDQKPRLTYSRPLFDSWVGFDGAVNPTDILEPEVTDISESEEERVNFRIHSDSDSDESIAGKWELY